MDNNKQGFISELTYSKDYWEGFKAGLAVRLNKSSPHKEPKVRYYDKTIEASIKSLGDTINGLETKEVAKKIGFILSSGKSSASHRILCHHIKACGFIRKNKRRGHHNIWVWIRHNTEKTTQ